MQKRKLDQNGFSHIIFFIILAIVIGLVGYSVFRFVQSKNSTYTAENAETKASSSSVKIKSMPIEVGVYDPATGKAGEIVFPKAAFDKGVPDLIFWPYGQVFGAEYSANGTKANPQPTFLAPIGTKVRSLVDGEVVAIPQLYSNDYSVHVQGEGSDLIFETEHVDNVSVKVGDKVKAGQPIAEVGGRDSQNYAGLGMVEIGVLKGGNPPTHLCLFDFLDDSIKTATLDNIARLEKDWETFRGKPDLYGTEVIAGCVNRDPITDNNNSQTGTTNN